MSAKKTAQEKIMQIIRMVVLFALIATAVFLLLSRNLDAIFLERASADAYAMAVDVVNKAVSAVMRSGFDYSELMRVTTDDSGRVTFLQANTVRMNELAMQTALTAQQELQQEKNKTVSIYLGAALGIGILSGAGPKIAVRIVPVGAVSTKFSTEFEQAGINQTRHKIFLSVTTRVQLVLPAGNKTVSVTSQVLIAESIVVGLVPDSFIDVGEKDELLNTIQ